MTQYMKSNSFRVAASGVFVLLILNAWTTHAAADEKKSSAIQALLSEEKDADSVLSFFRLNALNRAAFRGDLAAVQRLVQEDLPTSSCEAVSYAAFGGHDAVVRHLVEHGANVKCASSASELDTPLIAAALANRVPTVRLLLKLGADVNTVGTQDPKMTPLCKAAAAGSLEVGQILLEAGAAQAPSQHFGRAPIHLAVSDPQYRKVNDSREGWRRRKIVELLLEHGADLESHDQYKCTPLQLAAAGGYTPVVALLLEKGADVAAVNAWGVTALDLALRNGHGEIAELLRNPKNLPQLVEPPTEKISPDSALALVTSRPVARILAEPSKLDYATTDSVRAYEDRVALPWEEAVNLCDLDGMRYESQTAFKISKELKGERTFATVVLENEYLRVLAIPELSGVVYRAVYKPTGEDLFQLEGKVKNYHPHWGSGVKMSFPYYEHGQHSDRQPASWRIVEHADGAKSLAMWMEFSRFGQPEDRDRRGRYASMMLSQVITLHPHTAAFDLKYILVNPMGYKQGLRFWNDTHLPRVQTKDGVVWGDQPVRRPTSTELILPAAFASGHGGRHLGKVQESDKRLAEQISQKMRSIFAWDISYGFCGAWYPEANVNRLRITDPQIGRGTKIWFDTENEYKNREPFPSDLYYLSNMIELWGSFDNVFEGVENWIEPGECAALEYRYAMTRDMGKVAYANHAAAVAYEPKASSATFRVTTWQPVAAVQARLDGKDLGTLPCAPDQPAVFTANVSKGRLELLCDGKTIVDEAFPLILREDTTRHQFIQSVQMDPVGTPSSPELLERQGATANRGIEVNYYEALADYPEGSTAKGRLLYREGFLRAAAECLKKATSENPGDGEACYYLGLSLLENGEMASSTAAFRQAIDAKKPVPAAHYFLALAALRDGEIASAQQHLNELLEARPRNWEARLLDAWLKNCAAAQATAEEAEKIDELEVENPADPRVQFIRLEAARRRKDEPGAKAAMDALSQLLQEPGASRRLDELKAATRGQFQATQRLATIP